MGHLGTRLATMRQTRHLSQRELARRSGVPQAVLSLVESGKRTRLHSDMLKSLAQTLGCTSDYLLGMYEDDDSEREPAAVA